MAFWLSAFVPRRHSLLVFGAWQTRRYGDNPRFVFEHLVATRPDLDLVWCGDESLRNAIPRTANARFVRYGSWQSMRVLLRAGTCVVSHGSEDVATLPVLARCQRVYLGHGIAIKKMGMPPDAEGSPMIRTIKSWSRRPYSFQHWAASSDVHATKLLYENRYALISPDAIEAVGQPRLDGLFASLHDHTIRRGVRALLRQATGLPEEATLITYLPTFRDSGAETFSFAEMSDEQQQALDAIVSPMGAWVAQKGHQAEARRGASPTDSPPWLIDLNGDPSIDTQDLLVATDILITDYSGCYIDFLIVDRPIVHFCYDLDQYQTNDRGLYFDLDDVAGGDIVGDFDALCSSLRRYTEDPSQDQALRKNRRELLLSWEHGTSTARAAALAVGDATI